MRPQMASMITNFNLNNDNGKKYPIAKKLVNNNRQCIIVFLYQQKWITQKEGDAITKKENRV